MTKLELKRLLIFMSFVAVVTWAFPPYIGNNWLIELPSAFSFMLWVRYYISE
jgi:hypothetical protein